MRKIRLKVGELRKSLDEVSTQNICHKILRVWLKWTTLFFFFLGLLVANGKRDV